MRILPHILLAYLAIGLQRGLDAWLGVRIAGGVAKIELPWIAAAFIAATLPPASGPIAAAIVGLAYDLTGDGYLGTHAVAFGLAGLLVAKMRATRVDRLLIATVAGAAIAAMVAWLLGLFRTGGQSFIGAIGTAFFTALLALPFVWPLWKLRGRFLVVDNRI